MTILRRTAWSATRWTRILPLLAIGLLLVAGLRYAVPPPISSPARATIKVGPLAVDTILPEEKARAKFDMHGAAPTVVDGPLEAIGQGNDGQAIWIGRPLSAEADGSPQSNRFVVQLAGVRLHPDIAKRMTEIRDNPKIIWREVYCRDAGNREFQCTALDRDPVAGDRMASGAFHYFDLAHALVAAGLADATASLPVIPTIRFIQTMPASSTPALSAVRTSSGPNWFSINQTILIVYMLLISAAVVLVCKFAPAPPAVETYWQARNRAVMFLMFATPAVMYAYAMPEHLAGSGLLVRLAQAVGIIGSITIVIRGYKLVSVVLVLGFLVALGMWIATGHW